MKLTPYQEFIHVSRYARWIDEEQRRETWPETVDRYVLFFKDHLEQYGVKRGDEVYKQVRSAILNMDVLPSMRALMCAGPALRESNMAGFNCSFVAMDDVRAFDEIMYVLMCGTGLGFSVEARYTDQLPVVPDFFTAGREVDVEDSREGWADALRQVIRQLYDGEIPTWNTDKVRPAGARLKTFGGRASGPGPLVQLFEFTIETFKAASGRRLSPVEVHDLCCKIGDVVVSGGVRRSALISLSDLSNFDMAKAKSGSWWEQHGHRALANNTAVYYERPTAELFLREFRNLIESQSGERGLLNLTGVRAMAPARRDAAQISGCNPCGEISLRSMQTCNLSEVVIKPEDTPSTLKQKVAIAAILGTWQSTLTDFKYVRPDWRKNCEEERLLGVSLTGIYGNRFTNDVTDPRLPGLLDAMKKRAVAVNEEWAARLGINVSASVTTVKPSGTVSQLTGVSSGVHPWHSSFYARTVRGANTDPVTQLMIDAGVPNEPDIMAPEKTTVFSFPITAPSGAVTRADVSALAHLEMYRIYRENWSEHTVSITVTVRPEEWVDVAAWVYRNWDICAGISFLPYSEHTYKQAPYTDVTDEEFVALREESPASVRFADLVFYESEDATVGSRELACSASDGSCEVVDLV